jgi:hypothetical protein
MLKVMAFLVKKQGLDTGDLISGQLAAGNSKREWMPFSDFSC